MNMNFTLQDLQAFVAVADLGSFTAAAAAVHISQPALTRRVRKLESSLGVRLFERTTRKVELTFAGREFVHKAQNILCELEMSLLSMHDKSASLSGQVTIACIPSMIGNLVAGVIKEFHQSFPRTRIRLWDDSAPEILLSVARSEADFGITYISTQEPDLDFKPILREPFVVVCRHDHPLADQRKVSWSDLAAYEYITLSIGSANRALIDQALTNVTVRPRWLCETKHVPALMSLIKVGMGVGVVPQLAMPEGSHSALVSRPLIKPGVSRTMGLITRRGRPLSAAAQELQNLLLKKAAANTLQDVRPTEKKLNLS